MAPLYKQMNSPQRNTRKALIGQVSNLLVKRKNPGMGKAISKPVAFGNKSVAMRSARGPYGGATPGIGSKGPTDDQKRFRKKIRNRFPRQPRPSGGTY